MRLSVKRTSRIVGGWVLLALGGALLVLPGPGLLVIAAALALLAPEYPWAARLLRSTKDRISALRPRRDAE
jgi:putative transmembrane protein PGPGW